jgi:hypothetical protein
MRTSGPISLFSERQATSPPTASIFISIVAHGTAVALVATGLVLRPRIIETRLNPHEVVRHIDLHMPLPPVQRQQAAAHNPGHAPHPDAKPAPLDPSPSPQSEAARQVAQVTPAPQTLLQPKLKPRMLNEKIPLPTVVIWQTENTPAPKIVPPPPKLVMSAVVPPSVDAPNEELKLDKIAITSTQLPLKAQPITPSTTSPVVTVSPQKEQAAPQTTSVSNEPPTPAEIASISDLRKDGPAFIPPVNQTASANSSGALAPSHPEDRSKPDNGKGGAQKDGKSDQASGQDGRPDVIVGQPSSSAWTGSATVERIALPKDGQFSAVIVGSSLQEMYPEAAELWSGRLAYTVYLHVGLAKSWILQYSLPANADAALGGNAAHLAAPWPYTIMRPNIALNELNADAVMIHGIVNTAGRFETLAVAFPPRYPQADFVIASLRQWEFRPATQGGQPTSVEVLLIIPGEPE